MIANQRPRLTGFVGAQRFLGDNGNFTLGPAVGGSISLPFTARRAYATAQAAARSDVNAALAERTATLSNVRADLLAARARYEAAQARLAVCNAALLTGAREERESALAAYRAGTLTLIELLDFERALARAEIDRLTSQIDAATARVSEQPRFPHRASGLSPGETSCGIARCDSRCRGHGTRSGRPSTS